LELLDSNRKLVTAFDFDAARPIANQFTFPLEDELASHIHLAQLRVGERASTLAPVTHRNWLAQRRREPTSGKLTRSASVFEHAEGIELFLLDAFEELNLADLENTAAAIEARRDHTKREPQGEQAKHLTYDEFMAERTNRQSSSGSGNNSLAGTHCDGVRSLLNRLIGDGPQAAPTDDDDTSWMDLGDEAQAQGVEDPDQLDATGTAEAEDAESLTRPADRAAFKNAVKAYMNHAADTDRAIGPNEVLRLRLLLMTILWNASCGTFPKGLECTTGEEGWPRLILRAIAAFFHGKAAPVRRLVVEQQHLEMPVDFVECWATVVWSIDAIGRALPAVQSNAAFLAFLPKLREEVTRMLALEPSDYASQIWQSKWSALERAIGERLFGSNEGHEAAA
jgi:hypothetical protein